MSERKQGCEAHQPNSQRGCMDCAAAASELAAPAGSAARHRLKLAKLNLYSALLALPNEQLTVNEVELGYRLALDGQVQEHLEQHMSNPPNDKLRGGDQR